MYSIILVMSKIVLFLHRNCVRKLKENNINILQQNKNKVIHQLDKWSSVKQLTLQQESGRTSNIKKIYKQFCHAVSSTDPSHGFRKGKSMEKINLQTL